MNPFAAFSWFWRAWRGRSITFAVLFALAMLGVSAISGSRHLLSRMGAPWYVWLFFPLVAVAVLARMEAEWMPDAEARRKWALRLVVGSIILSMLVAKFTPKPVDTFSPRPPASAGGRADPHGR